MTDFDIAETFRTKALPYKRWPQKCHFNWAATCKFTKRCPSKRQNRQLL